MGPKLRRPSFAWVASLAVAAAVVRGIFPASSLPGLPGPALALLVAVLGLGGALLSLRGRGGDPGTRVLVAFLGVLLAVLLSHSYRLTSDGVDHFVYLRSLWIDHDLDLENDYRIVSPRGQSADPATPTGRTGNVHPIGPAILWSPLYLLADVLSRASGRVPDGTNELYKNAVSIAGLLCGWAGLLFLYRAAVPFAGRAASLVASLGIGAGTFLFWYLAYAPTMAHAPAFGAAALFLLLWLHPGSPPIRAAALLGATCGLCALVRWADGLLFLLPLVASFPRLFRREEWGPLAREALAFVATAVVVFSPQMLVWKALYGSFLTIPQGARFVSAQPAWGGVLFSPWHGLFSWSPLLYLGALGLLIFLWSEPLRTTACFVFLFCLLRLNAGVADWWGGAAFGGRRFDAALPFLGLGLAVFLCRSAWLVSRRPLLAPAGLVAMLVLWNLALATNFLSGQWDYSEPVTFEEMGRGAVSLVDRTVGSPFSLPGALFEWLRQGTRPPEYETLFAERRYGRWSMRVGSDERMFLEEGWSELLSVGGVECRFLDGPSSGLVVPLHRGGRYRFGARLILTAPGPDGRVRLLANDRVAGSLVVTNDWADQTLEIPAVALRAGRNHLTFKMLDLPARSVACAAAWLEPEKP